MLSCIHGISMVEKHSGTCYYAMQINKNPGGYPDLVWTGVCCSSIETLPFLRVTLTEKGTHFQGFFSKKEPILGCAYGEHPQILGKMDLYLRMFSQKWDP